MTDRAAFPELPYQPDRIAELLAADDARLLLVGAAGAGKSTLAAALARELAAGGRGCWCLSADPGSPAFGVPGAVNLGRWQVDGWRPVDLEAVGSLDAARFRLPLLTAARRLFARREPGPLLIDSPGMVRGAPAAELAEGLIDALAPTHVLVLAERDGPLPLAPTLRALADRVCWVASPAAAVEPGRAARAERRTALWDAYLAGAVERRLRLRRLPLLGAAPPRGADWQGRQVGLLREGRTVALGEAVALAAGELTLRVPPATPVPDALVVRDAARADGRLATAKPPLAVAPAAADTTAGGRRLGDFDLRLVNGVFGDPLLLIKPRRERRCLLFDLGATGQLGAGVLHTVSDIFITHAHIDHIGGFLWLLRNRLGEQASCRLYGPPGLAGHLEGFLRGVLWDRIGDRGPAFEVAEFAHERVMRYRLQAGAPSQRLDDIAAADGVLLSEPGFRVRAAALDHGFGTVSLAYVLETPRRFKARKDRLRELGLPPGPWLGELKQRALGGSLNGPIAIGDGRRWDAAALAREVLFESPGVKLAYATDLAATAANRERLAALAQGADLFFCECSFLQADADQAERTGHLTTAACTAIATAAGARRLVPFHFSRRYQERLAEVYAELRALHPAVVLPVAAAGELGGADGCGEADAR